MMTEKLKSLLDSYNEGLRFYRNHKFEEALNSFKKALEVDPEDGPSKLYLDRCEMLIKNPPPADWDGVFTMTSK